MSGCTCGHEAESHKYAEPVGKRECFACDCADMTPASLFHVVVDGVRVASDVSRGDAQAYLDAARISRTPGQRVLVCLADREKPLLDKLPHTIKIPRRKTSVSDAERTKLLAALEADGTLTYDT